MNALEQKLAIAETKLQNNAYLTGDNLTLTDIQFGHILFRYYDIEVQRATLPHLAVYYSRLTSRPAFREHVMISYEKLRA